MENNLSKGSIIRQLVTFSLPFLLSNIIQSLYNIVDLVIVGNFSGQISMAGVSIGSQLIYVITAIIQGFALGGTVIIGQYLGSDSKKDLDESISTFFTFLIASSVFVTLVLILLQDPILSLMQTPKESYREALNYYLITAIGIFFIFLYNGLSAVMRGIGNSKVPLYSVVIACLMNILLDILFVKYFGMKAAGVAIATVISQAFSVIVCIVYIRKHNFIFDFKLSSFSIKKEKMLLILKMGIPSAVQRGTTNLSFLILSAMANSMGVVAAAAVGAGGKVNSIVIQPALAMSSSITAISAHNLGAKKLRRASNSMWIGMIITFIISGILFVIIRFNLIYFIKIFDNDEEFVKIATKYLGALALDWLVIAPHFSFNGLFNGASHTEFCLLSSIAASILIRVPVAYVLVYIFKLGIAGLGYSAAIATFISLIVELIYYFAGKWKVSKIIKEQ